MCYACISSSRSRQSRVIDHTRVHLCTKPK